MGEQRHRAVFSFLGDDRRGACEIIGMRDLISSPSQKKVYMEKMLACSCNETLHCYCNICNLLNEFLSMNYLSSFFLSSFFSEAANINVF